MNPHPPGTEWHRQWESSTGGIIPPVSTPIDPEHFVAAWVDQKLAEREQARINAMAAAIAPPRPKRFKVTDLVAVRFVGITALAAVIGLPIWWTGWHLLDRYLGWIWT